MKSIVFGFIVCIMCFCGGNDGFAQLSNSGIRMRVVVDTENGFLHDSSSYNSDFVDVKIIFSSYNDTSSFIFDNRVLTSLPYNNENFVLKALKNIDLDTILKKINNSQIVVESENPRFRFLSNISEVGGSLRVILSGGYSPSFWEYKVICPSDSLIVGQMILRSDLKNDDNDKRIRLHYLFKPNNEQKTQGYKEFVVSSNWFDIFAP